MKSGPRSPQLEKALAQKRRPNTAKNKLKKKKKKKAVQEQIFCLEVTVTNIGFCTDIISTPVDKLNKGHIPPKNKIKQNTKLHSKLIL